MKKADIIKKIQRIFEETDSKVIGFGEYLDDMGTCPAHFSVGNTTCLIEGLYPTQCEVVTYAKDREVDSSTIGYEEVSVANLKEILTFLKEVQKIIND